MPFMNIREKYLSGGASVAKSAVDVAGKGGGGALAKLIPGVSGAVSSLGTMYLLSQLADVGGDFLTEAYTGKTKKMVELAKQQMENERSARSALLEFQKQLMAKDERKDKSMMGASLIDKGLSTKLALMNSENPNVGAGDLMNFIGQGGQRSPDEDIMLNLMTQVNARQQAGQPISPLMALGIAL